MEERGGVGLDLMGKSVLGRKQTGYDGQCTINFVALEESIVAL